MFENRWYSALCLFFSPPFSPWQRQAFCLLPAWADVKLAAHSRPCSRSRGFCLLVWSSSPTFTHCFLPVPRLPARDLCAIWSPLISSSSFPLLRVSLSAAGWRCSGRGQDVISAVKSTIAVCLGTEGCLVGREDGALLSCGRSVRARFFLVFSFFLVC